MFNAGHLFQSAVNYFTIYCEIIRMAVKVSTHSTYLALEFCIRFNLSTKDIDIYCQNDFQNDTSQSNILISLTEVLYIGEKCKEIGKNFM